MSDDSPRMATVETEDGVELEAEIVAPAGAPGAVVVTHPHPTYGGSMHTPVPTALFGRARDLGLAALRFNFRGVGRSTGTHDEGRAERLDVQAAIEAMREEAGDVPLVIAGWSFGADVGLAVGAGRVAGWMAVAAPLAVVPADEMVAPDAAEPKLLLVPEHDQFRSPEAAREAVAGWTNTAISVVPGTDHFLAGGLGVVADQFETFMAALR